MRENRTYGSEGREASSLPDPYPVGGPSPGQTVRGFSAFREAHLKVS